MPTAEVAALQAEADQAKAAYAASQDEVARLKAEAPAPTAELEAAKAEAETAKAAYAAAQEEIARLKAEAPAPRRPS